MVRMHTSNTFIGIQLIDIMNSVYGTSYKEGRYVVMHVSLRFVLLVASIL
jgi:hypothetical protein